ncbi:WecB/TagA/CpsF family glycosyltransferase [Bacteroides sp.]|uniref:WecB/TagA/CpsF family glycosyltransferase n=2 Tax=Bacteroides TaxID=816 RepID=UPI0004B27B28|nr:WecB/TagA/CpsF family glycosyltransferase [Bacteroides sp.]
MLMNVFKVNIEFDKTKIDNEICKYIKQKIKGYVCVVDANVLTMAQKNVEYRNVINSACINTCDGSSIATMVNLIYKTSYMAYNGPEIFGRYIEKPIKQLLLGNTKEKVDEIRSILKQKNINNSYLEYLSLPFCEVNDFDYEQIACQINKLKPDIIWVSLGAPKQELFMNNILPYIEHGLMFGIGAAFNFYTGYLKCPSIGIGSFKFIWLDRLIKEPRKIWRRIFNYIKILPGLFYFELKRSRM